MQRIVRNYHEELYAKKFENIGEMDLTDIYRAFHSREAKYTFFSNAHGSFSKIDNKVGHKTSPNKF